MPSGARLNRYVGDRSCRTASCSAGRPRSSVAAHRQRPRAQPARVKSGACLAGECERGRDEAKGFAKEMSKEGGRAADRESEIGLRGEAIERGLESGMLELGPGPHLPIPEALVAGRQSQDGPKNIEHPENNATYNFEAHSTLLDLFTQGGVIAVASFLWLTISTSIATCRAGLSGLCTWLTGLTIFVIFHLIIRHPLLWFAITLCLVEAARLRPGPSLRQRSA